MLDTDLLKLAKTHLGLHENASSAQVPQEYLNELKNHLVICPDDTKFQFSSQPNCGFGRVICLENGCYNLVIELQGSPSLLDGGREIGIGSLSAYRLHISQHPTHSRSRLARLKTEARVSSSSPYVTSIRKKGRPIEKEPSGVDPHSFRAPVQPSSPPAISRNTASDQFQQADGSLLNAEPAKDVFERSSPPPPSSPETRTRSPTFGFDVSNVPLSPPTFDSVLSSTKRSKPVLKSRTPLVVNTNAVAPPSCDSASLIEASHADLDIDDIRTRINQIQAEISHKQDLLDRLLRKSKPSAADLTRIQRYIDELDSLRLSKSEFGSCLPEISAVKTFSLVEDEANHLYEYAEAKPNRLPYGAPTSKREQTPSSPLVFPTNSNNMDSIPLQLPVPLVAAKSTAVAPCSSYPIQVNAVAGSSSQAQRSGHILHNPFLSDDEDENGDVAIDHVGENETARANAVVMQHAGAYIPNIAPTLLDDHDYDEDGNFRGRGKNHFKGPVAKADDIEKFLVEAGNAESFDQDATVGEALKKLGIPSMFTLLPGMEVALMTHQIIGVAWMAEKEKSYLKGGCLADEMGLGKTVQMIALMMKNRSDDRYCKTTLIIAPTALLDQWRMEIEVKTNVGLKVLIYHGPSKPKRAQDLLSYDVVVTTFQTMALEWLDLEREGSKKKAKARKDDSGDEDVKKKNKQTEAGLLFQVEFYRVVLDEAQGIRNQKTRVSRAVTGLQCKYRWCLTGTPVVNGLSDTYGYIRFLQIPPWYDFSEFHAQVGRLEKKNPQLAITRLQTILNTFLLRRKKDSKLDGKVLVDLPSKDITLQRLEFTEEEREIYDAVEQNMQTQFNRFLRAGTVLKNYHHVLVLLLRLRQCCSHPALIQEDGAPFVEPDEVDDDPGIILKRARELVSAEFVYKMKAKFREAALERMRAEKESEDASFEADDCPICYDNLTNAVITPCGHSFCKECIHDVFNAPHIETANEPGQNQAKERLCPSCRAQISRDLLFEQAAFMPTDEELREVNGECKGKTKARTKARNVGSKCLAVMDSNDEIEIGSDSEYEDDDNDKRCDFIVQSDEDEEEKDARKKPKKYLRRPKTMVILDSDEEVTDDEENEIIFDRNNATKLSPEATKLLPRFLPSTKLKYMMEHIKQLFLDRPNEKILVVSQWTSCLILVSQYLQENNIHHVKYQGGMSRTERELAVRLFMAKDKDKARVMLMSLKCGGVGLNLTRANNVISLDLGWSQATEDQAFDRVHRLGQLLPVKVQRLVIENTVEDRILRMQERKQILADGSLGEGSAKKIQSSSISIISWYED
ncbi:SNF2 family N-terminal domain-containing protein [Lentinula detonsa]|uniref:SNF2 family N-terminal domain-containing protein n=1 Tax=Lentinula detonsa TaxID=2804962 RepID=A0A9W8P6P7_9AGAR|nr:SNF2 family N-terminal domain-containing protein [Lentinula detonsa]